MARVLGYATARGVLMVEREERVLLVGDEFEEGVAEERLVEGYLVDDLSQGLAIAIHTLDKLAEQAVLGIVGEALARDVVGLVVDYASMYGRAARHRCECQRKGVVATPAPEVVALDLRRGEVVGVACRVGDAAHGRFVYCMFHCEWFLGL